MAQLVVMRHGESTWTDKRVNRFAGWVDVPLTNHGREQARHAGNLIADAGLAPVVCMTSLLGRSRETADIVLDVIGRPWLSCLRTWRLNERHYGAFQGQTRPAMRERYGDELFQTYRRGFSVRPPQIELDSPYFQAADARYAPDMADGLPGPNPASIRCESLADVGVRLAPWWEANVEPRLVAGECVLVVTHGSVVRSIVKRLEGLSDDEISHVNVPTGVPLVFEFRVGEDGRARCDGKGRYLDERAAVAGIQAVRELGA